MSLMMKNAGGGQGGLGAVERRSSDRVAAPFPALLSGLDYEGHGFEFKTVLDNFSAGGLYVRLPVPLKLGTPLLAVIRLVLDGERRVSAPGAAAQGLVVRSEARPDGSWGTALCFTRHSFIYAEADVGEGTD